MGTGLIEMLIDGKPGAERPGLNDSSVNPAIIERLKEIESNTALPVEELETQLAETLSHPFATPEDNKNVYEAVANFLAAPNTSAIANVAGAHDRTETKEQRDENKRKKNADLLTRFILMSQAQKMLDEANAEAARAIIAHFSGGKEAREMTKEELEITQRQIENASGEELYELAPEDIKEKYDNINKKREEAGEDPLTPAQIGEEIRYQSLTDIESAMALDQSRQWKASTSATTAILGLATRSYFTSEKPLSAEEQKLVYEKFGAALQQQQEQNALALEQSLREGEERMKVLQEWLDDTRASLKAENEKLQNSDDFLMAPRAQHGNPLMSQFNDSALSAGPNVLKIEELQDMEKRLVEVMNKQRITLDIQRQSADYQNTLAKELNGDLSKLDFTFIQNAIINMPPDLAINIKLAGQIETKELIKTLKEQLENDLRPHLEQSVDLETVDPGDLRRLIGPNMTAEIELKIMKLQQLVHEPINPLEEYLNATKILFTEQLEKNGQSLPEALSKELDDTSMIAINALDTKTYVHKWPVVKQELEKEAEQATLRAEEYKAQFSDDPEIGFDSWRTIHQAGELAKNQVVACEAADRNRLDEGRAILAERDPARRAELSGDVLKSAYKRLTGLSELSGRYETGLPEMKERLAAMKHTNPGRPHMEQNIRVAEIVAPHIILTKDREQAWVQDLIESKMLQLGLDETTNALNLDEQLRTMLGIQPGHPVPEELRESTQKWLNQRQKEREAAQEAASTISPEEREANIRDARKYAQDNAEPVKGEFDNAARNSASGQSPAPGLHTTAALDQSMKSAV